MSTLKQLEMTDPELAHVAAPVNRVVVPRKASKTGTAALKRNRRLAILLIAWMPATSIRGSVSKDRPNSHLKNANLETIGSYKIFAIKSL